MASSKQKIIEECLKIIEFWEQGYSDREICKELELSDAQFRKRLESIRKDGPTATASLLLFEKYSVRFNRRMRYALSLLDDCDEKSAPAMLRAIESMENSYIDSAQKLGVIDPRRLIVEHQERERSTVRKKTTTELVEEYNELLSRHIA